MDKNNVQESVTYLFEVCSKFAIFPISLSSFFQKNWLLSLTKLILLAFQKHYYFRNFSR